MSGQGRFNSRSVLFGVVGIIALTASALMLSHWMPIETASALPSPFGLPKVAEVSRTLLSDGRTFEVHGGRGEAYLVDARHRTRVSLPHTRRFGSLTVMPNGQVLLWGGIDDRGELLPAGEWLDPDTLRFVTTGRLGLPARAGHTLTVLSDGTLLMSGGWSAATAPGGEAVRWDPRDHRLYSLPGTEATPRFNARATIEADGSVSIAGGVDEQGRPLDSIWRFDPITSSGTVLRDSATDSVAGISVALPNINKQAAPLAGPLVLRFSQPVDLKELNKNAVSLLGPNGIVRTRVVGVEGGRLAFIQLPDEMYPGSRYTVFVQDLKTSNGEAVPYTAIGFTTAHILGGMAIAGDGKLPEVTASDAATASPGPPLHLMAGTGHASCASRDFFHLCRERSYIKDGAWYPGQNNVADATGGHWRLYQSRQSFPDLRDHEAALDKNVTALIGQVRRIDETPVANVEISIGEKRVRTDAQGVFVLTGISDGRQEVFVDGRTASRDDIEYGRFLVGTDVKPNVTNRMPFVMYLPRVLPRDKIDLPSPTSRETVLTHPEMPGLELHVPAGAVFRDREGHVLSKIAIVPTPVDRAPFPLPDNFPMYFTIQPGDAVIQGLTPAAAKGIRVVYPNYGQATQATQADFWVYTIKQGWQMYGGGRVSANAGQIVPDPGVSLVWALGTGVSINPDNPPGGRACNGPQAANPVDLRTGMFFHEWTDLAINDVMPLTLSRAYRSDDSKSNGFGIGSSSNFEIHLYGANGLKTPQLVMPCGEGIAFDLVSGALDWPLTGTVWQHKGTDSAFYGATLQFLPDATLEGAHWILNTKSGTQYAFSRHSPNTLSWIQDRHGNQLKLSYQGGLLDQVTSPSGRSLTFEFEGGNRIRHVIDHTGRKVAYTYKDGALDKVAFPDQTTEKYTYDATHRLLTMEDRRGNVWVSNQYDAQGRISVQALADSTSWKFAYTSDPNGEPAATTITDPNGHRRYMFFDPISKYQLTDTDAYGTPLAQTTTYKRQASGLVDSVTDALGRTTTYTHDNLGNVTSVTRLAGTGDAVKYSFTYTSDYSQLASVTDPLGQVTRFSYEKGCLVQITDALGYSTSIVCNASGQPTGIQDALGHLTTLGYQGFDLHTITDALARTTSHLTDTLGRRIASKDPKGTLTLKQYDDNDRVVGSVDGLNQLTTVSYDGNGNVATVTTPNSAVISYAYDARNRVTQRKDALGQLESWTYDGMDGVLSYTDRKKQVTLYDYDALNRLTLTSYADGSGIRANYDQGNRVTELLDTSSGSLHWRYDGLDRVTETSSPQGDISYTYDAAGRRTGMRAAAQASVNYTYDDGNRLVSLSQGNESVQFGYDEINRRTHLVLPNGIKMTYSYDANSQITGITYNQGNGVLLGNLEYSYDGAGLQISQTGSFSSQQLPDSTISDGKFDLNNRQSSFNGSTLRYDANGNLIVDGINAYTWNARNQLTNIRRGDLSVLTYGYDSLGRRAFKKLTDAADTRYLYDNFDAVQESGAGLINPIFVGEGIDERYARDDSSGRTYFLLDAAGSTLALTDGKGELVKAYRYDTHGNAKASGSDKITNPYKYTGRELDVEGLYYYRARYYSSAMRRFVSEDPIGFRGAQLSFYAYVGNSPLNFKDPYGLAQFGFRPLGDGSSPFQKGKAPGGASATGVNVAHENLWFDDRPDDNIGWRPQTPRATPHPFKDRLLR